MTLVLHFNISLSGEPAGEKTFRSADTMAIKAGRRDGADLHLAHASVSRLHALFEFDGNAATILDLGSGNGTSVNGSTVSKAKLKHGDEIQIGEFTLVVGIGETLVAKGPSLTKPALSPSMSNRTVSPSGRGSEGFSYDRGDGRSSGRSGGGVIFLVLGLLALLVAGAAVFLLLAGE